MRRHLHIVYGVFAGGACSNQWEVEVMIVVYTHSLGHWSRCQNRGVPANSIRGLNGRLWLVEAGSQRKSSGKLLIFL